MTIESNEAILAKDIKQSRGTTAKPDDCLNDARRTIKAFQRLGLKTRKASA